MKQKDYAWKVVSLTDGKMLSWNKSTIPQSSVVEYKFDEWTQLSKDCQNPFVFVFNTRKNARNFCKIGYSFSLRDQKVIKVKTKNLTSTRVGKLWSGPLFEFGKDIHPIGTMFADSVMPIKSRKKA